MIENDCYGLDRGKSYRNSLRLQEKCQCDLTELSFLELKDAHQINL